MESNQSPTGRRRRPAKVEDEQIPEEEESAEEEAAENEGMPPRKPVAPWGVKWFAGNHLVNAEYR